MINRDDNKFTYIILGISFFLLISLALFTNFRENKYEKYAKKFKGETIGLTMRIKRSGRSSFLRYCFYANNEKVLGGAPIVNASLVGKFYKVKYDLNDPKKGHYIVLKNELRPDSVTLVNAGFTKRKIYKYDAGRSCKYIEELRWE